MRSVKISSPDVCLDPGQRFVPADSLKYVGWSSEDAVKHYLQRLTAKIPDFETMEEKDLNFIKASSIPSRKEIFLRKAALTLWQMVDAGKEFIVNNCSFGYLSHRIVFYLLNLHIKSRRVYFVRVST